MRPLSRFPLNLNSGEGYWDWVMCWRVFSRDVSNDERFCRQSVILWAVPRCLRPNKGFCVLFMVEFSWSDRMALSYAPGLRSGQIVDLELKITWGSWLQMSECGVDGDVGVLCRAWALSSRTDRPNWGLYRAWRVREDRVLCFTCDFTLLGSIYDFAGLQFEFGHPSSSDVEHLNCS